MPSLEFRPPVSAWSINEERRRHWSWRAERSLLWRDTTFYEAKSQRFPKDLPPSLIVVSLPVAGRRRRDPHNWLPAVKSITDGLVLYGCWPDDTPEYVAVAEPALVTGAELVVVRVTPR